MTAQAVAVLAAGAFLVIVLSGAAAFLAGYYRPVNQPRGNEHE